METKALLYGIIGFMAGGLLVSIAATTFERPESISQTSNRDMVHMENSLREKTGDEFDEEFLNQMILHHEGALAMAQMTENQAKHQEIKDMSKSIISAQEDEIRQMRKWQKDWGYVTSNPKHNDNH